MEARQISHQCLQLKGASCTVPDRVRVCGVRVTPGPPFHMFMCIVRCVKWSERPVYRHAGTHPPLMPVKPPPTATGCTHHSHIQGTLPHCQRKFSGSGWPVLLWSRLFLSRSEL